MRGAGFPGSPHGCGGGAGRRGGEALQLCTAVYQVWPNGCSAQFLHYSALQCPRENLRASLARDRARVDRCPSTVELLWGGWREDCFSPHRL